MANEWTKVELYGANNDGGARRYTIIDGVSVSQGTLLRLVDPRTASYAWTSGVACAGVSAEEKQANDGATSITCYTDGVFTVYASGAITAGAPIAADIVPNKVHSWGGGTSAASYADIIGYALGTAAGATNTSTLTVRLQL